MKVVPLGMVKVLYLNKGKNVRVEAFAMQETPVIISDFLRFVQINPGWTKSQIVRPIFGDTTYLADWRSDYEPDSKTLSNAPITQVSWFAARAYCQWLGLKLPTIKQWERAAQGRLNGSSPTKTILSWYSRSTLNRLPPVSSGIKNEWGIIALHGMIREWTEDFNSVFIAGESRGAESLDKNQFCGLGAEGAGNKNDYAAFMRFAFRASLKANYATKDLGFRCVKEGAI